MVPETLDSNFKQKNTLVKTKKNRSISTIRQK